MRSRQEILEEPSEHGLLSLSPEELPHLTLLDIRSQNEATNELLIQLVRVEQGLPLD